MRERLLAAVMTRLERIVAAQDPTLALEPGALDYVRRLAGILRDDDGDLEARFILGWFSWYRYLALPEGTNRDALEAAIQALTPCFLAGAEDLPEPLLPLLAQSASSVANTVLEQASNSNDLSLITAAVSLWQQILAAIPTDHPDRAGMLSNLCFALWLRFWRVGELADVDGAITAGRAAVQATPADHPERAGRLSNLGVALWTRFERLGKPVDLDEAITMGRAAVQATPADHPDRARMLSTLSIALLAQFRRIGVLDDLNEAITVGQASVQAIPADHPDRAKSLLNLSSALQARFERVAKLVDLDEAITMERAAIEATPTDHPDQAVMLAALSTTLLVRYGRMGVLDELDEAITVGRAAVQATPADHPAYAGYLSDLCLALRTRFERGGTQVDLDEAITVGQAVIQIIPADHPGRAGCLSNLGVALQTRFERLGTLGDLNEAITAIRQAVQATPADHPDRARYLSNLGLALEDRFKRVGALGDLNEAITAIRQAVQATPADHPDRIGLLSNLSATLVNRFGRVGGLADLDEAITMGQTAVQTIPGDHPDRAGRLTNLSAVLVTRFERVGGLADLDEAITMGRAARQAVPADHPDRTGCFTNLCLALRTRFERVGTLADLDEAITMGRAAVQATPADHLNRASTLTNLGGALYLRSGREGTQTDLEEAIATYAQAVAVESGAPSLRIRAAWAAASLAAPTDIEAATKLLETAVRLLPETASRQIGRGDQQYALGQFTGLASTAAALTLLAPETDPRKEQPAARALRLLELGRGVMLSQMLDTRSDLTDLQARYPVLAARFIELRDQLDKTDSTATLTDGAPTADGWEERQFEDRHQLADAFKTTVADIRSRDGFGTFLLPPEPDYLLRQAEHGPVVVINVSPYRSDAILLTVKGISAVPLPDLTQDALTEKIDTFRQTLSAAHAPDVSSHQWRNTQDTLSEILEWLWDAAARPILDELGYDQTPADHTPASRTAWPRVWWVPSGILGFLPLHAAGYHREPPGPDGGRRTVLDRVISSYTPTVRALGYARERNAAPAKGQRALIVAMPTTPGLDPLHHVAEEAELVRRRLSGSTLLIEDPATADAHLPTKINVFTHLADCGIAHFACHGHSHPNDPSQSLLLLHDHETDPFTVASLAPIRLEHARLAYLSACHTALNPATDLIDEAIHLATAFHLAGYPHVVGTLWEIDDDLAVRIAHTFYTALTTSDNTIDTRRAAQALHHAVRAIRDEHAGMPSWWAAYLHTGA